MWSDEQINDAIRVLLNSAEQGEIQRVESTPDTGEKECYLVVGGVTYTDPLYLQALDSLIKDGKLKRVSSEDGRESYRRETAVNQLQ